MKCLHLLVFLGFSLVAHGQIPSAFTFLEDFEEAKDVAQAENKYILVYIWGNWSLPCNKMDKEAFREAENIKYFNKRYTSVKLDADAKAGRRFVRKYRVDGVPALLFLNAEGVEMHRIIGYVDPAQLLSAGDRAFRNPKKQGEIFKKLYGKERNNPRYLQDYISLRKQIRITS